MNISECYDCGEPLKSHLFFAGIGMAVFLVAGCLSAFERTKEWSRAALVVAVIWALLEVNGLWHNSILWPRSFGMTPLETPWGLAYASRWADATFLLAWCVACALLFRLPVAMRRRFAKAATNER